jgi:hypothetical protein
MAFVATRNSMSSLSIPSPVLEENVNQLGGPFFPPARPPPLHTSRARYPGPIDISKALQKLRLNSVPFIQPTTPRNAQEKLLLAAASSSSSETPTTLPITRVRYNNSRLASSRGFNSGRKKEPRRVSPSVLRPIPGEFLEIESEFRQSSASSSPALSPSLIFPELFRREEAIPATLSRNIANDPLTGQTCNTPELVSRQPSHPKRLYFENAPSETAASPLSEYSEEANPGTRPPLFDNSPLPEISPIAVSPIKRPRAPSPRTLTKSSPIETWSRPGVPSKTRSCIVCSDSKSVTNFPISTTVRCTHPPQTCLECLQSWIASSMESKGWDKVTCPECDEKLDYENMKTLAAPDMFAR